MSLIVVVTYNSVFRLEISGSFSSPDDLLLRIPLQLRQHAESVYSQQFAKFLKFRGDHYPAQYKLMAILAEHAPIATYVHGPIHAPWQSHVVIGNEEFFFCGTKALRGGA